ncbi:Zn-dependent peptidase [Tupanvirus deep ocean]|uniref:Zn-dependent peptidase n=2 Tax=Tupanvirus TaxID=2094720 RepID=A0AC62A9I5_9VIRU|nr:Zn-dependent peptidase [Tupanvirus deep ocean]QKU34303.1 Zn-dependent peptidase [Tupanvirus deep ocean]
MKYIKKILDNGMHIIMVPVKSTNIVTIGFFIKAGSRNETDENSGIAHFLEHMMFKGTENRNAEQLFNELDTLGAVYNAATTSQHTYYYVYGNSDDFKHLLDIMLDIYINAKFDINEINKERKVIIEEMRMREDSPLVKLYTALHKKIFTGTSLSRNIIGNIDTISNFKKRDLIDFRSSLYKPENTVFVITGNFNPQAVFNMTNNLLGPLENSQDSAITYFNEKPIILKNMESQKEPYVYIKKNNMFQQVYVLLCFPMYDLYNYKNQEIDLLTQLLSAGFSSRLNKALRENNGITYVSSAYPIVYSDVGIYIVQMVLNPTELVRGLKIVFAELKKIKDELMTKDEMKKIINVTRNETIYSLIKPTDLLMYYGINFLSNREYKPNLDREYEKLKSITRVQIQKVAREIFNKEKINLFMYGNIQETDFSFIKL